MEATLFKQVGYSLSKLIEDVDIGEIGLPDIQRPFVWTPAKVRDLFDSMYRRRGRLSQYKHSCNLFEQQYQTQETYRIEAPPLQAARNALAVSVQCASEIIIRQPHTS